MTDSTDPPTDRPRQRLRRAGRGRRRRPLGLRHRTSTTRWPASTPPSRPASTRPTLAAYCLMLGDDALVIAQRLSEWCSRAPDLEEEVALANIALDLLGQTRLLLARAAAATRRRAGAARRLAGAGRGPAGVLPRRPEEFRYVRLVEVPDADFADAVVRLLLFAPWRLALLERLDELARPGARGGGGQGGQGGRATTATTPPGGSSRWPAAPSRVAAPDRSAALDVALAAPAPSSPRRTGAATARRTAGRRRPGVGRRSEGRRPCSVEVLGAADVGPAGRAAAGGERPAVGTGVHTGGAGRSCSPRCRGRPRAPGGAVVTAGHHGDG